MTERSIQIGDYVQPGPKASLPLNMFKGKVGRVFAIERGPNGMHLSVQFFEGGHANHVPADEFELAPETIEKPEK